MTHQGLSRETQHASVGRSLRHLRRVAVLFSVTLPCSLCLSEVCGDTFSCGAIRDENLCLEIPSVFRNVSP